MRALRTCLATLFATMLLPAVAQEVSPNPVPSVLTATQATWSITNALVADTPIEVVNVPVDGRELAILKSYLERRKAQFEPLFSTATAVIAMTNALPADPLYRFAREANIRVVAIDAAQPWTYDTPGVALVDLPASDVAWADGADEAAAESVAPYFWLSLSNTMRMADLIGSDLAQLFPAYAATIDSNRDRFKRAVLETRNDWQAKLIEAGDVTVFALTGDFIYLTNDMGLFVDGYFIRQDVRWTDSDLTALTAYLHDRDIKVVIHKWLPSDAIQAAIAAAGAQLVVLETGDPGRVVDDALDVDGLQRLLVDNLDKLTTALQR